MFHSELHWITGTAGYPARTIAPSPTIPETRKFYLQQGEGNQLTYLEGQPVLTPTQLAAGNQIRLGDTVLRFVPLCGKDFDWTLH